MLVTTDFVAKKNTGTIGVFMVEPSPTENVKEIGVFMVESSPTENVKESV